MYKGIILVGAPGTGKSTQAKKLDERFPELFHIESSKELMSFAEENPKDERSEAIRQIFSSGGRIKTPKLLDDKSLVSVMTERFKYKAENTPYSKIRHLLLWDGVVRTKEQAREFMKFCEPIEIWNFDYKLIGTKKIIERILARGRPGETAELIGSRLRIYQSQTAPLIPYMKSLDYTVKNIDPSPGINEIFSNLEEHTEELLNERYYLPNEI
ncbi:nucleoside monophosphate kinase [Candidatus Woesearchaeota archaeon]|nr:nucleoside monophosphate kinase [Candidatus Woesearchaeota archaeon]